MACIYILYVEYVLCVWSCRETASREHSRNHDLDVLSTSESCPIYPSFLVSSPKKDEDAQQSQYNLYTLHCSMHCELIGN